MFDIKEIVKYASAINKEYSGLYPGKFKDVGTFEAVLSKSGYYSSNLEFSVEVYISLQKCHVFHDGNKRTSLSLFQAFLEASGYKLKDKVQCADYQILYIENKITIVEFRKLVYSILQEVK